MARFLLKVWMLTTLTGSLLLLAVWVALADEDARHVPYVLPLFVLYASVLLVPVVAGFRLIARRLFRLQARGRAKGLAVLYGVGAALALALVIHRSAADDAGSVLLLSVPYAIGFAGSVCLLRWPE